MVVIIELVWTVKTMAACNVVARTGFICAGLQHPDLADVGKQHCVGKLQNESYRRVEMHHSKLQRRRIVSEGIKIFIGRPIYTGRVSSTKHKRVVECMAEADKEVGEKPSKSSSQLEQLEQLGFGGKGSGKKGERHA